jgi:hypothetical protein
MASVPIHQVCCSMQSPHLALHSSMVNMLNLALFLCYSLMKHPALPCLHDSQYAAHVF